MMHAAIHGRIGKGPETRTTKNGNEVAFTSIAVDVTPFGDESQETLWMNITAEVSPFFRACLLEYRI